MKLKSALQLLGCIGLCQLAGIVGSLFTVQAIPTWYAGLVKPPLNPPAWIFGPVWTTLYALMGIALYLIWRRGLQTRGVQVALGFFAVQLVLNTLWSIVFFGLMSPLGALAIIVAMWIAIAVTIVKFYNLSKPAAYLLVPYLAWVSFAMYLNFGFWYLN